MTLLFFVQKAETVHVQADEEKERRKAALQISALQQELAEVQDLAQVAPAYADSQSVVQHCYSLHLSSTGKSACKSLLCLLSRVLMLGKLCWKRWGYAHVVSTC